MVDNRGGAGGNIALGRRGQGRARRLHHLDGAVGTHALNPALYKKMPYDPVKDFAPISLLNITPHVLVVNRTSRPRASGADRTAKANPGKYSYASSGNGTPLHLSGELFKSMAGIDLVHVPYKGAGPALVDVMGGHVPIMFDNLPPSLEHIRPGKLRALGGHDQGARALDPGAADHRRDAARLRDLFLERPLRPRRHPEAESSTS